MNQNFNYMKCKKQINIINEFRKLWEEHAMWTRSFIISTAGNLGDLSFVTKRLLRNPSDFADALRKYYGDEKAKKFETLLTEHLTIAAKLVNAAKASNTDEVDDERKKWYKNANEIAEFLAGINPYWSESKWKMMLYDHLKITETEATERLKGEYEKDVELYDALENQILEMADYMASGIAAQQ